MPNPVGRPSDYKPEYCQMLINHMAQGYTFESFAAIIDVNRDTLYAWKENFPEFSDAHKNGKDKSLLFWEKLGMAGMTGSLIAGIDKKQIKNFNAAVYIFSMKNKHRWKSEHDVEISSAEALKIEIK